MKKIINQKQIVLNSNALTKQEAFEELSQLAVKNNVVEKTQDFYQALTDRETTGSTGFEDGFAIPHGKSKLIKKAAIFVLRFNKEIEWNSLDGQLTKMAICLAIPEDEQANIHLKLLSEIATKLLDQNLRKILKTSTNKKLIIESLFNDSIENQTKSNQQNYDGSVIGITACAAGIAHTYMAAKAIENYAQKNNYKVKIEKQGANGIEDRLTSDDIENANFMIIAVDINPEGMERFKNVPIIKTKVADPLHKMDQLWKQGIEVSRKVTNQQLIINYDEASEAAKLKPNFWTRFRQKTKAGSSSLKNAVLNGLSYAVPIIVAGMTIAALVEIIIQIAGADTIKANANWLNTLGSTAGGAVGLLLAPLLSGYIAYAMADKPGLFPGLMGGVACNAVTYAKLVNGEQLTVVDGLGFIGGLISGIIVGYMMKLAKQYIKSKKFQGVIVWTVYPIFGSLIIMSLILFGIGYPIALLVDAIFNGLSSLQTSNLSFILGAIIGMMCVVDLGGPFNKVAWAFSFASMSQAPVHEQWELLVPYTAFWAAGIGTGWTTTLVTTIGRKYSNQEEKEAGKISWILSSLGITEGAIPFAISDPKRVIPSFMLGGAISGGLTATFGLGSKISGGGFITMAGIQSTTAQFPFAIWAAILLWLAFALIGTLISTTLILGLKFYKVKQVLINPQIDFIIFSILSFGIYPMTTKIIKEIKVKKVNKKVETSSIKN